MQGLCPYINVINMVHEWIGVIGTVIGVLAGGGVTYFVTQAKMKHEENLERNRRQLSKLESTHKLFSKVAQQTNIMNANLLMDLTDGVAIQPAKWGDVLPLDDLQMHADIYIPEVSDKANRIINKWMEFGRIICEVILKPISNNEKGDYIIKSTEISTCIDKLCKEAKQVIVEKAKIYL